MDFSKLRDRFKGVELRVITLQHSGGTKFYQAIQLRTTLSNDANLIVFRYGKQNAMSGNIPGAKYTGLSHVQSPGQTRMYISSKMEEKSRRGYEHFSEEYFNDEQAFDKLVFIGLTKTAWGLRELERFLNSTIAVEVSQKESALTAEKVKKYASNPLFGSF